MLSGISSIASNIFSSNTSELTTIISLPLRVYTILTNSSYNYNARLHIGLDAPSKALNPFFCESVIHRILHRPFLRQRKSFLSGNRHIPERFNYRFFFHISFHVMTLEQTHNTRAAKQAIAQAQFTELQVKAPQKSPETPRVTMQDIINDMIFIIV